MTESDANETRVPGSPAESADVLSAALLLPGEPVGVRLFTSADAFDAWPATRPETPVYYCAAVHQATLGASLKLALSDVGCDTSPRTLGLEPGFFDDDFIESYVTSDLYRDRSVADAMLAGVAILRGIAGVAVGPLRTFAGDDPPDVVIIATTPYGVMRLTQAAAFDGHRIRNTPIGMHGVCAESTAAPHATGEISVSLLCSGTRYIAGWDENLMSVGIPGPLVADVSRGLLATAERFELNDRKDRIRTACRRSPGVARPATTALASLRDEAGYFVHE